MWESAMETGPFAESELGEYSECRFSLITPIRPQPQQAFGHILGKSSQEVFTFRITFTLGDSMKKYSDLPKHTMLALLENRDDNADVTITTSDGQVITAHRNILSAHSEVFKAMFATEMEEKNQGVVKLKEFSGEGFKIVLKFLYTGQLDESWGEHCGAVLGAADKFLIAPLHDLCDLVLPTLVTEENYAELHKVAELHRLHRAAEKIKAFNKSEPDKMLKK
ncbi:speckle-type POZ protein-like [Folsomia candida]|uniref:speckle-type POZ protein-like n=1 Tax=Folsomia candida TaxID=158441 RepID=UPI0016052D2F|nr:speckle-type POZ protein-like [Folsomia candida]